MADDTIDPDEESENFQSAYLTGDRAALWKAIVFCAANRIPLPEWVCNAITILAKEAETGEIASWDDVFGQPWGKGQRRGAQTRSRVFEFYIPISAAREKVRKAKDARSAARRALPKLPESVISGGADAGFLEMDRSEQEGATLAKAIAAYRKARKELADAKQAEKKAWDGFGLSRKSVQRFYYPFEGVMELLDDFPRTSVTQSWVMRNTGRAPAPTTNPKISLALNSRAP